MKTLLVGSELFIAVNLVLSPKEAIIFKELNKNMNVNRKTGKRVSLNYLKKELGTDWDYTRDLIKCLKEKIRFAYDIKEEYVGGYTYYILHQKKNM